MLYIDAKPGDKIPLGRKREHHARTIQFDISWWRSTYGDGVVSLLHQRAGDVDPYPCAITENGSIVEWLISEADTEKPSHYGKYEMHYRVNGAVVKSATGTTCVANALGEAADEPPEPQKWWVDQVLDAGRRAEEAAERAEEAAGGTVDHSKLKNRDAAEQHPISAITGLEKALREKQPAGSYLLQSELPNAINSALTQAKESGLFDGEPGYTPQKGVDYFDGEPGYTPQKGKDYFDGAPGYTPQKGKDYYTDADKQEIVTAVLANFIDVSEVGM